MDIPSHVCVREAKPP